MIVLFHTFFIVTNYIITLLTKSIFYTNRNEDEHKNAQHVFSYDVDYVMESDAEIEEGIGVRFFPPVYVQRYTAVKHVLQDERWCGKIRKIVDFGCAEFGFFIFVKDVAGIRELLTVDVDREVLERNCCRVAPLNVDYLNSYQRSEPLMVHILNGSIANLDPRLLGTDAVICIEVIEHLYPETLEEVPFTVFGYIEPLVAVFTTPNSEFNVLFPNLSGFRHHDHKFEWTRSQFEEWADNITTRYPAYSVKVFGVGKGPPGTEDYGCCSQMAIFVKNNYQNHIDSVDKKLCNGVSQVCETDLVYEEIRKYEFPYYVDSRTEDEKILHEAEYYIRVLAFKERYETENGICIPLCKVLHHVEKYSTSSSHLKNLLEDAGWELYEDPQENGTYVIYPGFNPESSSSEFEEYDVEDQEIDLHITDNMEENWDKEVVEDSIPDNNEFRDATSRSGSAENRPRNLDWDSRGSGSSSHSKLQVCDSPRDSNVESSSCGSGSLWVSSDNFDTIPLRTQEDEVSKELATNTWQSTNSSPNSIIFQESCRIPSTDLESKQIVEQAAGISHSQISDSFIEKLVRRSEMDESRTLADFIPCDSMEMLESKGFSYNEALTNQKVDEFEENLESSEVSTERNRKNKISEDKSPYHVSSSQLAMHSLTSNSHFDDCSRVNSSFDIANRKSLEEESEGVLFNLSGSSMLQQKSSHSLCCISCATPSTLESSQERSLVESYSLDEQNDKAVDSGYPNSYSVQDMDMDLTPEQVDEIYSESEEIVSESNSYSAESDSESGGEDNLDVNHLINNDGFLLNFRNEILYEPMFHAVENGDVANNNRDGEGNNAVAVVPLPREPEIEDQIDHDFIPLLAAAEDFDNDNDLILPEDVQPFPDWLLHLLVLVNPVNGAGDLNNYVQPPGPLNNLHEDVDLEDDDIDEVFVAAQNSNSSDLGDPGSDLDGSDNMYLDEEPEAEVLVPGDLGGGGEPDSFQGQQ